MTPRRIQRRRVKGWKMPPDAIYVGRPTRWGNPFQAHDWQAAMRAVALGFRGDRAGRNAAAVALYRLWITGAGSPVEANTRTAWQREVMTVRACEPPTAAEIASLRGKNLACWCGPGLACHADVLLEIANPAADGEGRADGSKDERDVKLGKA